MHRIALGEDFRNPVTPAMRRRLAEVLAVLPRRWQIAAIPEIDILREVTPGIHVDVQLALVRRTVERLREAGVVVVVVEAPVHPAGAALYPPRLRTDFRAFGASLAADPGRGLRPARRDGALRGGRLQGSVAHRTARV